MKRMLLRASSALLELVRGPLCASEPREQRSLRAQPVTPYYLSLNATEDLKRHAHGMPARVATKRILQRARDQLKPFSGAHLDLDLERIEMDAQYDKHLSAVAACARGGDV